MFKTLDLMILFANLSSLTINLFIKEKQNPSLKELMIKIETNIKNNITQIQCGKGKQTIQYNQ